MENVTLLDYFAGQALVGLLASNIAAGWEKQEIADTAYKMAGKMLNARSKIIPSPPEQTGPDLGF